jgi:hypothetical protein
MRSPKIRRYAVIIAMALMLASVVVLADVIYYYKGVITAQVSGPPLVFYNSTLTYTTPTGTCTSTLNSYVPGYANFTALPTGFIATIQLTNASYAYFYHALGLVVNTPGWLYVTNVKASGSIIENLTIIVQSVPTSQSQSQTMCSFTVISDGQPITNPTQTCSLSPGPYYISVLVQPINYLSPGLSETVTLYFGYNVAKGVTVPLPPISG